VFVNVAKNDKPPPRETAMEGGTLEAPLSAHKSPTFFKVLEGAQNQDHDDQNQDPGPGFRRSPSASWRIPFLDPVLISLGAGRYSIIRGFILSKSVSAI
jgi:hypothetical protein